MHCNVLNLLEIKYSKEERTKEEICNKMFAYSYSVSTDKRNVLTSLFMLFATARSVHFVLKNF